MLYKGQCGPTESAAVSVLNRVKSLVLVQSILPVKKVKAPFKYPKASISAAELTLVCYMV